MEPTTSHRNPIVVCEICQESKDLDQYHWTPLYEIDITRILCSTCGMTFIHITSKIKEKIIHYARTQYNQLEQTEKTRIKIEKNQLNLFNV